MKQHALQTPRELGLPGRRYSAWALALLAMTPALATAQAPDAADTDAPVTDALQMEEIVVTARRRDENLSKVPTAITAFGPDQLVERGIRSDSDLQLAAPGLTIRQTQGNNSLTYSIRGQTADTFSGSPSAVVTYFNDVPLTVGQASSFYDLESVQVLKGPQGTLFGRNATGGAVLYTAAKPKNEVEALIRLRGGNLDLREAEGMLNLPLGTDRLLARAAFNVIERDGYIENLIDGSDLGELDRKSGRLSLMALATDTITNTTVFQFSEAGGTNTGASYTYSVYGCGETNNGFALNCSAGLLFGPGLDAIAGPGAWDAYLAAHPDAYAPGLIAYVDEQRAIGPYKTRHPGGARHDGKDRMLTNTTEIEVSDNFSIKNIFGLSHTHVDSEQPQLGAPFVTILTANPVSGERGNVLDVDSMTEELQLQGTAGNLEWITGLYYQNQTTDTYWPQTYFDVSPIIPPSALTNAFRLFNESYAIYAQGSYDLGAMIDGLSFTAGLRYTWEKTGIAQLPESTYTSGFPAEHENFSDPSWEVGLEYQATPSLFTYLKTRGSFRSGGFNGAAPPVKASALDGGNLFDSEHVKDVEAGVKFSGLALGRPTTINLAIYSQWITDVQRVEFPDPDGPGGLASIAVTANVPEARVRGIELEANLMPADWLTLGLSGALTDAKFTDGTVLLFGNTYEYGPFGDTPKRSGVAFLQVDTPLAEGMGSFSARAEIYAQSEQYFSNAADSIAPGTRLPSYHLVNGRIAWNDIMGSGFSVAAFGKNLLDDAYFTGGMTLAAALGHNAAAVGEPRTYGLEASYKF